MIQADHWRIFIASCLSDAGLLEALRAQARADHQVLDLVNIPGRAQWPCPVEGLCW